jgi:hypothetical protein
LLALRAGERSAGGYGLYLKDSKPTFTMNLLNIERPKWQGADALPPGKHAIVFDWKMEARGEPLAGTLSVDGKQVAQHSLPKSQPVIWAWDETFDVGLDTGTSGGRQGLPKCRSPSPAS